MSPHTWLQLPQPWLDSAFLVDRFTMRCAFCGVALVVRRSVPTSFFDSKDLRRQLDANRVSDDCDFEVVRKIMEC